MSQFFYIRGRIMSYADIVGEDKTMICFRGFSIIVPSNDEGITTLKKAFDTKGRVYGVFTGQGDNLSVFALFYDHDPFSEKIIDTAIERGAFLPQTVSEFRPNYCRNN